MTVQTLQCLKTPSLRSERIREYGKISVPSSQFCYERETTLKIKILVVAKVGGVGEVWIGVWD